MCIVVRTKFGRTKIAAAFFFSAATIFSRDNLPNAKNAFS
jgi:hypothetical protein